MFNCDYLMTKGDKKVCACTVKGCRLTRIMGLCKMGLTDIELYKNDTAPIRKNKKKLF